MIPGQTPAAERPSQEYAPQNAYRSYEPETVFTDSKNFNSSMTAHERLSHEEMIKRANGSVENLNEEVSETGVFE